MKDWRRAAGSIAKALKTPRPAEGGGDAAPTEASDDANRADTTLHLAVALALAGEEAELVQLGSARADQMAKSRWRDVFPLITAKTMAEADLRSLARGLAPVDRFRAHLARDNVAR